MLSGKQLDELQAMVDSSDAAELEELFRESEEILTRINAMLDVGPITQEQKFLALSAIEIITRIEQRQRGGGWWFRTKRRMQLVQMYLGG